MHPVDLSLAPGVRCRAPVLAPRPEVGKGGDLPTRLTSLRGMLAPCQPTSKFTDTPSSVDVTRPGRNSGLPAYLRIMGNRGIVKREVQRGKLGWRETGILRGGRWKGSRRMEGGTVTEAGSEGGG